MSQDTKTTESVSPSQSTPITVVSGPLGAGKTTLVNRLLQNPGGRRIAVIVNDMGEVNVDASLIERKTDEGVIDLSNGCICCQLQDDLVEESSRLAREREFDHLVVETSGISEPLPVARALTRESAGSSDQYDLDTMVSVVDAYGFWKAFDPDEGLPDAAPTPERPLTDVMIDQIEFCDVLLLNKCDMVPDDDVETIETVLRELQPRATVHRTTYAEVDPEVVLDTDRFDFEDTKRAPGWKRALADGSEGDDHDHGGASAAEVHGVESTVYERDRPFHPGRFDAWLDDWDGDLIRAKGFTWVASRPDEVLGVNQAGPSVQAGPIGEWGADEPATRLVFIGRSLDPDRLAAELDDCLVADEEREKTWHDDPFPR
ncbi:GTP-binding protein [halophilic archaeon]|nr:GTP-binding protein [halophilic archaeon]